MSVLAGLIPVFLILGVGIAARRFGLLTEASAVGLNRLVANVALPALFLLKIGTSPLEQSLSARLMGVTVGAKFVVALAALLIAQAWRLPRDQRGVLSQAAMRGNIVYITFPVILASQGDAGLRLAAVTAAVVIPFMNVLAVALLEFYNSDRRGSAAMVGRVAVNPMVWTAVIGLALAWAHWQPWPWLANTLQVLSDFALPGALLALGAQLELGRWTGVWRQTAVAAAFKVALLPLLGLFVLRALGAPPLETAVGVLLLASPTAVASYPVAADLGGDTNLAGACVLVSTVAGLVAYVIWTLVLAG